MANKEKILHRLNEHAQYLVKNEYEWVGVFLQGSQNYELDYEGSDIDSKAIVLPHFDELVFNIKPISFTHVMDNGEHIDIKDLRLYFECFKKGNINFVEVLFTPYFILNPEYAYKWQWLLTYREEIAHYNNYAVVNAMVGMAAEKRKALCHPYEGLKDVIERYGFDPKQLHHIVRLRDFIPRFLAGEPYASCLIPLDKEYVKRVKTDPLFFTKDEAVELADKLVKELDEIKKQYLDTHPQQYNEAAVNALMFFQKDFLLYSISKEIL